VSAMTADAGLVGSLAGRVRSTLWPLLEGAERIAHLDFPEHGNVGDSAIWLGECAFLREAGLVPRLVDHFALSDYSRSTLERRLGRGTILLNGGGNLGDLWPAYQQFRERVIADFPRNPIIQLPQSMHFQETTALERARGILGRHPDLTILLRDRESLESAQAAFPGARTLTCPDMAFCLGPVGRPGPARTLLVWLARTDLEADGRIDRSDLAGLAEPVDWAGSGRDLPVERRLRRLRRRMARWPALRPLGARRLWAQAESVARQRVQGGIELLAQGERVVTDRLHGHILCELLGLPHALLDNSYGKLSRFHAAWTGNSRHARLCRHRDELAAWLGAPG